MRSWLGRIAGAAVLLALAGCEAIVGAIDGGVNQVASPPPYPVSADAAALHRRLLVADLHADPLLVPRSLLERSSRGHTDLPRWLEGGYGIVTYGLPTNKSPCRESLGCREHPNLIALLSVANGWPAATWSSPAARATHMAGRLREAAAASEGRLAPIRTRTDLAQALDRWRAGQPVVAALLAIEGAHAFEGDIAAVERFFALGVRMVGLVHFFDNAVGGSTHGQARGGLTPFGAEVVRRLETRGMLVDLAHASEPLVDDVLAIAAAPVVVSHTGLRALCDDVRNLPDRQVREIVRRGGLVGIGFWDVALCPQPDGAAAPDARAYARDIARAVRHVIRLTADVAPGRDADHVALGSDFDGWVKAGFDATGAPLITEALIEAGLGPDAIAKVMGGNVCRFLLHRLPGPPPAGPEDRCRPR